MLLICGSNTLSACACFTFSIRDNFLPRSLSTATLFAVVFFFLGKVFTDDLSLIESCWNSDTISWEDWSVRGGCFNIQWFQSGTSLATRQVVRSAYVSMKVVLDKNRTSVAVLQTQVLTWILAHTSSPLCFNMTPRLWFITTLRLSGNSPVMLPVITTSQNRRAYHPELSSRGFVSLAFLVLCDKVCAGTLFLRRADSHAPRKALCTCVKTNEGTRVGAGLDSPAARNLIQREKMKEQTL